MAVGMDVVLAGCTLIFAVYSVTAELPRKKFEYKLSLKGPHLIQSDGSIPFWTHGGNAIASDQSIRVTPSLRSQKGWVWSKNTNPHEHWEVEATFRISGRGRVGADGLAIWYTTQQGMDGPVFGGKDQWNGLGVFFDSFDNDGQHNNPYVMVMLNDGTKQYDHNSDGQHQQLGGCLRDFRNKPFPVKAKIEYYKNALTLSIHNGMTNNKDDYEICVRAENVNLPRNGYFGVSAATGGLADDHDLVSFITHSMTVPVTGAQPEGKVSPEDKKKFETEFDEYWEKLQKAQEEYKQQHPDKAREMEESQAYEGAYERELRMIFEGQNGIHRVMNELHRKVDELIGRQASIESQLSARVGTPQYQQQGQPAQLPASDGMRRHEVDSLLNSQRDVSNMINDVKFLVSDIQKRSAQAQGPGGGDPFASQQLLHQIRDNMNELKTDLLSRPNQGCPPVQGGSCLTPAYFFIFMGAQLAMMIGYIVYRNSKEAAAKKFY
ncbi:protein ERGIC-53-like isoform X2 [Lingula anatina]|uniref:Protein ERGIC-53-like isoform X2 n=1 Tax=Lingula anatina TaxID=7574 RepID=A0A1S3J5N7_LINAN|nr:protein ERGIC-53-like isoform X2 [Lingula anatina]|eukprot:XP_013405149.1 protein ERGIC-53-like isoform X2 [Lingula anatina]